MVRLVIFQTAIGPDIRVVVVFVVVVLFLLFFFSLSAGVFCSVYRVCSGCLGLP